MTIDIPFAVKLQGHDEVIQMRIGAETVSLLMHPSKQFDQLAFIIYLLATP